MKPTLILALLMLCVGCAEKPTPEYWVFASWYVGDERMAGIAVFESIGNPKDLKASLHGQTKGETSHIVIDQIVRVQ